LDICRQPLCHLDLGAVIDGPRHLVRHRFDQSRRRGMAVAALLDAAEWQMYLGADARQIDIAHAELALLAEELHAPIALRNHRHRQAVLRIVVDRRGLLVGLEADQGDMRTEDLLTQRTRDAVLRLVTIELIHERRQEAALAPRDGLDLTA